MSVCAFKGNSLCKNSVIGKLTFLIILLTFNNPVDGLHLKGTWKSDEFFHFLSKFGFQKTDLHDADTLGYIYGNITLKTLKSKPPTNETYGTLLVVDREYFLENYGNRSIEDKNEACRKMFSKINTVAYDKRCYQDGTQDFIRRIPCPKGKICEDEDAPIQIVPDNQFTYFVHDNFQARFWYVSMVACYRDKFCNWTSSHTFDYELEYDIWLVNGNPAKLNSNPFECQFSFESQDTVEIYLVFFTIYIFLVAIQIYATMRYHHLLTCLFTLSLTTQLLGFFSKLVHKFTFAVNGVGVETLDIIGTVIYLISQSLFMLLLLLLAKGWAITRPQVTWKAIVFCLWLIYTCINILLSIWNRTEIDVIEDIEEYQTIPGWISLIFRMIIMVWFLYELRSTMLDENDQTKLRFYLDFGAGILVWFFYLPMVALVALNVSTLWRQKLLLGITSSADFLAYATMAHLLWPSRSKQYFQLINDSDTGEELEEFSEAPHNVEEPKKFKKGKFPSI